MIEKTLGEDALRMAKKKRSLETAILQWAYQNRRMGGKAAEVLKSIEETEKTLEEVKIKKK